MPYIAEDKLHVGGAEIVAYNHFTHLYVNHFI